MKHDILPEPTFIATTRGMSDSWLISNTWVVIDEKQSVDFLRPPPDN